VKSAALGQIPHLLTNVRQGWKGLSWTTYTLAYVVASSVTKEKSLTTLTPGVNVIKLFSSVAEDEAK
jgi:hypothetical protein